MKFLIFLLAFAILVSCEKPIEERVAQLEIDQLAQYKELLALVRDTSAALDSRLSGNIPLKGNFLLSGIGQFVLAVGLFWVVVFLFVILRTRRFIIPVDEKPKLQWIKIDRTPNPQFAVFLNCILPGISYFMIQQYEKGCLLIVRSLFNIGFILFFLFPAVTMFESSQDYFFIALFFVIWFFFVLNHTLLIFYTAMDTSYIFDRVARSTPICPGECDNLFVSISLDQFVPVINSKTPPQEFLDELTKFQTEE